MSDFSWFTNALAGTVISGKERKMRAKKFCYNCENEAAYFYLSPSLDAKYLCVTCADLFEIGMWYGMNAPDTAVEPIDEDDEADDDDDDDERNGLCELCSDLAYTYVDDIGWLCHWHWSLYRDNKVGLEPKEVSDDSQ